jgi:hypothetical protein
VPALHDRGFPHAGLAEQHHGIRTLAVTENLRELLYLRLASGELADAVLPRQQVEADAELCERRRKLQSSLEPLLSTLVFFRASLEARENRIRVHMLLSEDGHHDALLLVQQRDEHVGRGHQGTAGAMRPAQGQLADQPCLGRHAQLALGTRRDGVEIGSRLLDNPRGVRADVFERRFEQVSFPVGEREEQVRVPEFRVASSARFGGRAVEQAPGTFVDLIDRDVEIFDEHDGCRLESRAQQDRRHAERAIRTQKCAGRACRASVRSDYTSTHGKLVFLGFAEFPERVFVATLVT